MVDLNIAGTLVSEVIGYGLLEDRPAADAANEGWLYYATDDAGGTLYRSDGADWQSVSASPIFAQDADPGAVGAGKIWVDTTGDPPYLAYVRNEDDDDWEQVGSASVITTKGDLIVGDASGEEARLAIGSNGQVLRVATDTPGWHTLAHGDLASIGADDHHARDHTLTGSTHTASGLTTGHVLQATGSSTFGFGLVPAHASRHATAGADPIAPADIGAATSGHTHTHASLTSVGANDHHNQAHSLTGADHTVSGLTAGHVLTATGSSAFGFASRPEMVEVLIDGGPAVISIGAKADIRIPAAGTITAWTLLANTSGSIAVDLWKSTLAAFPPVVGGSIVGANKPTITSATNAETTGLSWSVSAGDVIRVNVDSATNISRATLVLHYTRS